MPANERERLEALRRYDILDSEPEPSFDRITAIAARVLGVPICLITLVDSERQWFKSKVGLERGQTPREQAFCAHAILDERPMIVRDAHRDQRFHDNPLVTGAPNVRFYAGAPLQTSDGFNLGTLCAIDQTPRDLSPAQLSTLEDLAALVVDELELRSALRAKSEAQRALADAQAQLRENLEQLRAIVESAGEGIVVVDRAARLMLVNAAALDMLGLRETPSSLGDWPRISELRRADGVTPFAAEELPIQRALLGESSDRVEICVPESETHERVWLSVTARPLRDDSGEVAGGVVTFNDFTELRAARERVAELAMTDELTGLPNRRAFRELLARLVAENARGRDIALVIVDIDHFKRINDDFGHPTGDRVLALVAQRLAQRVRRTDFLGRYGGEEFCLLYVDVDQACAERLAEEQRQSIAALSGLPRPVTASFGVCASLGSRPLAEEELIARADAALYRAKREGRNRVCSAEAPSVPALRAADSKG